MAGVWDWAITGDADAARAWLEELALAAGPAKKYKDEYLGSALLFASNNGRAEVVELLLCAGADPWPLGAQALASAAKRGDLDVVDLLLGAMESGKGKKCSLRRAAAEARLNGFDDAARRIEARELAWIEKRALRSAAGRAGSGAAPKAKSL